MVLVTPLICHEQRFGGHPKEGLLNVLAGLTNIRSFEVELPGLGLSQRQVRRLTRSRRIAANQSRDGRSYLWASFWARYETRATYTTKSKSVKLSCTFYMKIRLLIARAINHKNLHGLSTRMRRVSFSCARIGEKKMKRARLTYPCLRGSKIGQ